MKFLAITLIAHAPVTWTGRFRPSLTDAEVWPRPLRRPIRVRHGSARAHRYHARFGQEVMHLPADGDGLTERRHRASLELFQSDIAPVLRREIPSRPFPAVADGR